MKRKKIGLLTWYSELNYGSILQAYALQTTINNLGYKSKFIAYNKNYNFESALYNLFTEVRAMLNRGERTFHNEKFIQFRKKYLSCTAKHYNKKNIKKVNQEFDTFICGSDQIWAPNVFDDVYMLSFAENIKQKISYAPSIGLNDIPASLRELYRINLKRFDSISVRESVGKDLLEKYCSIDAEIMPDPTLLLEYKEWEKLEKPYIQKKPYIFCYFLNENHNYYELLKDYIKNLNYEFIGVSKKKDDEKWMKRLLNVGPQEFLYLIHHAEIIFTDSYHGSIFSLIFNKKFYIFERFNNSDIICQNSRINQLVSYFNLEKCIIHKNKIYENKINYEHIEKIKKILILKGKEYLLTAIGEK